MNDIITFLDKVQDNLKDWIPLFQSLLWPVFALAILLYFRRSVEAVLSSIKERIERGGAFKAGFLEFQALVPSTLEEQKEKRSEEIAEAETAPTDTTEPEAVAPQKEQVNVKDLVKGDIRATYLLAEELALRKLSSSLKLKIERGVRSPTSPYYVFDGVAVERDRFVAVEVKFLRRNLPVRLLLRTSLERLNRFYASLTDAGKARFSLILTIVLGSEFKSDPNLHNRLAEATRDLQYSVHTVVYKFEELESEFDVR